MTPEIFLLCLFGAVLEMDTTYTFQFLLSRGIVAGPLLSLVTGDLLSGLQVGIFTELVFIDVNPLGGVLPPSAVGCCVFTLALHAMGVPLCFAFFVGVLGAILFSFLERTMRRRRARWLVYKELKIGRNPREMGRTICMALGQSFLLALIVFVLFSWISGRLMMLLVPFIPEKALLVSTIAYMAVPWIGLATLISMFNLRRGGGK